MFGGLKVEFVDSDDIKEVYSCDASRWYSVKPLGVFFPKDSDEVAECVRFCLRNGILITPRGGGSGLSGGAVPEPGGVVISTEKMNKFHFEEDGFVVAYAGAISGHVERMANKSGYTLPAQPSSLDFSTIGGNIAADSAGLRSVKYGSARDWVEEIEFVDGKAEIRKLSGRDARLLAGSEGTLGIITQVKMKLVRKKRRDVALFVFPGEKEAISFALEIIRFLPSAIEFMDRRASQIAFGYEKDSILVEFEDEYDRTCDEMIFLSKKIASDIGVMHIVSSQNLWDSRKKLGPSLAKIRPFKINEDVVLPLSKIVGFLNFVFELDSMIVVFGHIGVGILHTNIIFGGGEEREARIAREKVFDFVISSGGSITGEHGTGISKVNFVERELTPETIRFMNYIKADFDPNSVLNPTKLPLRSVRGCMDTNIPIRNF